MNFSYILLIFLSLLSANCFTITPNLNFDTSVENLNKWLSHHSHPAIYETLDDVKPSELLKVGSAYVKDRKLVILPGKQEDEIASYYGAKEVYVKEKYRFYVFELSNNEPTRHSKVETFGKSLDMTRSKVDGSITYNFGLSYDKTLILANTIQLGFSPEISTEIDLLKGKAISNDITCTVKAGKVGLMMLKTDYLTFDNAKIQPLYIKKSKKYIIKTKYKIEYGPVQEVEYTVIKGYSAVCHSE